MPFVRQGAKRTRKFEEEAPEDDTTSHRKESGEEFEDQFEDEFEEENVVDGEDWEDVDDEAKKIIEIKEPASDEEMETDPQEEEKIDTSEKQTSKSKKPKEVFLGNKELEKEEELIFDNSAYEMLHRANVQWPCLSIDIMCEDRFDKANYSSWFPKYVNNLNPELFDKKDADMDEDKAEETKEETKEDQVHLPTKYPFNSYVVAGSQAERNKQNCIYVMKWANLYKTLTEEEDENEEDAMLYFESVPHLGQINRIRSMNGSNIVASWGHLKGKGKVSIYNLDQAIKRVDKKHKSKSNTMSHKKYNTMISSFNHSQEGYALDWSPLKQGLLASGGNDKNIFLYEPTDAEFSEFVMNEKPLQGHKGPVEDLQFSPRQEHVLASCSVDKTVKLWDLRENHWKPQMSWEAHDADVNVISWNTHCPFLIASGSDDGFFKVWDLRKLQKDLKADPITSIKWHDQPITSIQFQPREE